jgi:diguanylate cyclase
MIKPISAFMNKNSNLGLSVDQDKYVQRMVLISNWKRVRPFIIMGVLMEISLIFFFDIPNILHPQRDILGTGYSYFTFHMLLFTMMAAAFIYIRKNINTISNENIRFNQNMTLIFTILFLSCFTIITGLDQQKGGELTVYIAMMLCCAILIHFKSPINYVVFGIPFLIFIISMFVFQHDESIRTMHLINGSFLSIVTIGVSKYAYDNYYGQVGKNLLLEEANKKLRFVSLHDPLTGLANRRNFEIQIEHELQLQKRYEHYSALVLIDLDRFKRINDQFGHLAGDNVLQEIADILCDNIREADLASRWGGEEFLLLLSHTTLDGAYLLVDRIKQEIETHTFSVGNDGIHITASFGIAPLFADEQNSYLASYHMADQAMYTAKSNGRNQIVVA